ncbi:hypothetical protein GUITHDRAFT_88223 [Guillardia theta CCMP2712]|uniref:Uncharacterized protein n=1 Tax=Guillardia theta (strain CCMP2712) TaxID=905079 RepID=L1J0G8_GUITC|nr:hypothetical protein GUITHDRAFT_88223 [Guillardia theta CCMP2712]EKX42001.1 hypothetical protein GUITHDRAFT_88223 [Guillardia theta CCMP2712]|eukprot:XP_005828981.1 hypothetical protein GUITHDRAFT_88223 [Guillardia theta CCMP2712]
MAPTLLSASWRVFKVPFMCGGLWKLPHDLLAFLSPFLVKAVYRYVDPKGMDHVPTWREGIFLCMCFFVIQYASSVALHKYFDKVFDVSMQMRGALVSCIYKKSLKLSSSSRHQKSLGELVNLMSVDVQRIVDLVPYLHNLVWSSPLQILLSMILLYRMVGVASLVGLLVMIAIMPINASILIQLRKLQEKNMVEKDRRVKQVSEMLHSIKVIKMFAWEKPLLRRIADVRKKEVKRLRRYGYIASMQSIFWNSAPVTVSVATFGAYAALGHPLTMQVVLPALSIINIMSFPLFVFPLLISSIVSGRVALNRINEFMSLEERDLSHIQFTSSQDLLPFQLQSATIGWNASRPILTDVNIKIPRGSLTAIVGQVGSGKSTLLSALLGDAKCLEGEVRAPREVGYVPQQAWIQNANIRDNILFGKPMDERRYREVLKACALEADLEKFPNGDETEIGERGVNLSGGQKQRIALARAVYQNFDCLLLDDVMSALDSHVGSHVLDDCLIRLLQDKTRVLVTHKLDLLPLVDYIVVLGDGKVQAQGTLSEIRMQGVDLESVIDNVSEDESKKQEEEKGEEGAQKKQDAEATPASAPAASAPSSAPATPAVASSSTTTSSSSAAAASGEEGQKSKEESTTGEGGTSGSSAIAGMAKRSPSMFQQTNHCLSSSLPPSPSLSLPLLPSPLLTSSSAQAARNGNDWWLTKWASAADRHRVAFYLGVYATWNFGSALPLSCTTGNFFSSPITMLDSVMKAPMSFFDSTPIGRILNRFSNDQDSLDSTLPRTMNQFYTCILRVAGTIAMISYVSPTFLFALLPVGYLYWYTQQLYSKTSRELKRIESTTKSPLYSHFGESIAGSTIIRAGGQAGRFCQENCEKVDRVNNLFSLINGCNRWLAVRLELCGNGIVTGAALAGIVSRKLGWLNPARASMVGLSLTLALSVTNSLAWMVRMSTEAEAQMNSVERVAEYVEILSEEEWLGTVLKNPTDFFKRTEGDKTHKEQQQYLELSDWPSRGEISFHNFSMRYRPDLPDVLSSVSLTIRAGEKVGICGRTGAGKSSLLMALFRMSLISGGRIEIDGQDITRAHVGLLREGLAIVPQEPMLFQGSIAYNLDPFGEYKEEQLWDALASVQLDVYVRSLPEKLEAQVGEGGSHLSVGQRQLLCMARALLRGTKILVLDEATAAVDHETDAMIQSAIRRACHSCTVITIAHRLNTILDYDKVLVLGQGQVLEFDSPNKLLSDPSSQFSQLVSLSKVRRTSSLSFDVDKIPSDS